ncbi:hypothetical protein VV11_003135 [Trichodesmium erythraeum 21-75]|nr:hypothetical protein [Trichodesmium erythraeum 21-75]
MLDADISKFFDQINDDALFRKIGQKPYRKLIKQWLKSEVFDSTKFSNTVEGKPQGDVIFLKCKHSPTRDGRMLK